MQNHKNKTPINSGNLNARIPSRSSIVVAEARGFDSKNESRFLCKLVRAWRKREDSNLRDGRPPTRFRVVRLQPLGHASTSNYTIFLPKLNHECYNGIMDQTFNLWLGIIVISAVGTIAHFLYEWTHQNKILGLFTAVNESTWEHIKIALTPSFLWCLYDGVIYGLEPNYFCAKLMSLLVIVVFIPTVFYSYKKFTKKPVLPLDIATFYVAIILSQLTFYTILNLNPMIYVFQFLSCLGLFVFFGCYMTLTLDPLKNFLFKDPITGKYGFRAHTNLKDLKNKARVKLKSKSHQRKNRNKK